VTFDVESIASVPQLRGVSPGSYGPFGGWKSRADLLIPPPDKPEAEAGEESGTEEGRSLLIARNVQSHKKWLELIASHNM
jgi:hypothetical protein